MRVFAFATAEVTGIWKGVWTGIGYGFNDLGGVFCVLLKLGSSSVEIYMVDKGHGNVLDLDQSQWV